MRAIIPLFALSLAILAGCAAPIAQVEAETFTEAQDLYRSEWIAVCEELQAPGVEPHEVGPRIAELNLSAASQKVLKRLDDICDLRPAVKQLTGRDWFCENAALPMDECDSRTSE